MCTCLPPDVAPRTPIYMECIYIALKRALVHPYIAYGYHRGETQASQIQPAAWS